MAGVFNFTVCRPPSTSRVTETASPATSTLEAKVPATSRAAPTASGPSGWHRRRWPACRGYEAGGLLTDDALEDLGDGERLDGGVRLHVDAAVGTHGKRGADGFGGALRSDGDDDDLGRRALLLQAIASSTAISSKGFIDIFTLASSTPGAVGFTRISHCNRRPASRAQGSSSCPSPSG